MAFLMTVPLFRTQMELNLEPIGIVANAHRSVEQESCKRKPSISLWLCATWLAASMAITSMQGSIPWSAEASAFSQLNNQRGRTLWSSTQGTPSGLMKWHHLPCTGFQLATCRPKRSSFGGSPNRYLWLARGSCQYVLEWLNWYSGKCDNGLRVGEVILFTRSRLTGNPKQWSWPIACNRVSCADRLRLKVEP